MPETRLYCSESVRFGLGPSLELVHSELGGATHLLNSEAAALLDACRTFKTLEQHAADACGAIAARRNQLDSELLDVTARALPSFVGRLLRRGGGRADAGTAARADGAEVEAVRRQLSEFVSRGLLTSDADLLKLLGDARAPSTPARPVTAVGVLTHDRVESLTRCLASYIENGKPHGRRTDFVVADDSPRPESREANRAALAALKREHGAGIFYAGPDEKRLFAEKLARHGDIPPEVITFALFGLEGCGAAIGANRNALLLHNVGEMFLSADDDTVCRVAVAPQARDGLALCAESDPTGLWFFPDRATLMRSVAFGDEDVLAVHEELLGRDLRDCVVAHADGGGPELSRATAQFFRGLRAERGSVLFTFTGTAGDSGMRSPHGYFLVGAETRRRLTSSAESYRSATTSREILRAAGQRTVSSDAWAPATALGFDNRAPLPPFFPVLRNEDGVYGATVRACLEHAYVGFLPRVLLHTPPEARSYTRADIIRSASGCRLCDILIACVLAFVPPPGVTDAAERLRALGKFLMEAASLAPARFEEFVRLRLYGLASGYAARLQAELHARRGAPDYWAEDVRAYLDALLPALATEEYIVPDDLAKLRGAEEARRLTRALVLEFGRLLCWWPKMFEAAGDLRGQGQRLAVEVQAAAA